MSMTSVPFLQCVPCLFFGGRRGSKTNDTEYSKYCYYVLNVRYSVKQIHLLCTNMHRRGGGGDCGPIHRLLYVNDSTVNVLFMSAYL
jgi:hypothetical protein